MELTIKFIRENFEVINELFFDNKLITPKFEIMHTKNLLGQCCWQWSYGKCVNFRIRISDMFDRTEDDIVNTIAHEMIHLYIRQNNITDTRPHHGQVFYSIADKLNMEGGFHIARTDSVEGCGLKNKKGETYYICCYKDDEGRYFKFRINPRYYNNYIAIIEDHPRHFGKAFIFTSTDDKAYASMPQCRTGVRGSFIDAFEYEFLKATETIIYNSRQTTLRMVG